MTFNLERTDVYVYALLDPRFPRNDTFMPELKFKPFYIGMGVNNRIYVHREGIKLDKTYKGLKINRIKAILKEQQEPIPIKIASGLTRINAAKLECSLIAEFGTIAPVSNVKRGILTNMTAGGDGGHGHIVSDEARARIRAGHLGKTKSDEHKNNLRAAALITSPITNRNPITREKLRQSTKAALARNPDWAARFKIAAAAAIRKYNADPVNREKISARLKGIPRSKEVIEKCKLNASKHFSNSAWMNNGEIIKRIPFDEIQVYLESGWIKGRKIT